MTKIANLENKTILELKPRAPYNFNANLHKPSHFPSSDIDWEEDKFWTSMVWKGKELGLKFENKGTVDHPRIRAHVFSQDQLSKEFMDELFHEVTWRFNFDSDVSEFYHEFKDDKVLGPVIKKWRGMKPVATNSLYEMLVIFIVLQNATVRRTVQMLENLFGRFGKKIAFDEKSLSTYWEPNKMNESTEQELRDLKLGYRAKFLMNIAAQFTNKEIDEFTLRGMEKDEVRKELLKLCGIGPASVGALLFEGFYFCNTLDTIPPWEQKIMSRLVFNKSSVPAERILKFFQKNYRGWEKLAFHYIWEDLFWRRKQEHIEWLEKEIRL
jgi:3-methyladenine DNA glycosylase/8-oxoguanine DNA glycosylase